MNRQCPNALFSALIVVLMLMITCAGIGWIVFVPTSESSTVNIRLLLFELDVSGQVASTILLFCAAVVGVYCLTRLIQHNIVRRSRVDENAETELE